MRTNQKFSPQRDGSWKYLILLLILLALAGAWWLTRSRMTVLSAIPRDTVGIMTGPSELLAPLAQRVSSDALAPLWVDPALEGELALGTLATGEVYLGAKPADTTAAMAQIGQRFALDNTAEREITPEGLTTIAQEVLTDQTIVEADGWLWVLPTARAAAAMAGAGQHELQYQSLWRPARGVQAVGDTLALGTALMQSPDGLSAVGGGFHSLSALVPHLQVDQTSAQSVRLTGEALADTTVSDFAGYSAFDRWVTPEIDFYFTGRDLGQRHTEVTQQLTERSAQLGVIWPAIVRGLGQSYLGAAVDVETAILPYLKGDFALVLEWNLETETWQWALLSQTAGKGWNPDTFHDMVLTAQQHFETTIREVEYAEGKTRQEMVAVDKATIKTETSVKHGYEIVSASNTQSARRFALGRGPDNQLVLSSSTDLLTRLLDQSQAPAESSYADTVLHETIDPNAQSYGRLRQQNLPQLLALLGVAESSIAALPEFTSLTWATRQDGTDLQTDITWR